MMQTSERFGRGKWSNAYVSRYMAANGVDGPGWFPCLDVLAAIRSGSLATLGTTSITRGALGA